MEQLLLRRSITLDSSNIERCISGKRIMITGAAGSIGSELLKQVLEFHPQLVVAVDQSENGISMLKRIYATQKNVCIKLRNITDQEDMKCLFSEFKPQVIFHTAAYKHVNVLETDSVIAIKNNIFGTEILADLSIQFDVEKFVYISTDKAVNPANVMGISKRISELYLLSLKTKTEFIITRFGNVLGSAGSVFMIFKDRISRNLPLHVTHPEVSRYFIMISEAVQLVLEAAAIGISEQIFILEMGKPILIKDLASRTIDIYQKPDQNIEIIFTGLEPGEKMHEELQHAHERTINIHQNNIRIITSEYRPNLCTRKGIDNLRQLIRTSTNPELTLALKKLL